MNKLILRLLLTTLAIVGLHAIPGDSVDIDKSRTVLIPIRTVPPIIFDPIKYCLQFPSSTKCNPCTYGSPIIGVTCGQGQRRCEALGGTCKFNQYGIAYCCPREHRGCCPTVEYRTIIFPRPSPFCHRCQTDASCKPYEKCCGICRKCVPAVY